jgi:hypothetical protein
MRRSKKNKRPQGGTSEVPTMPVAKLIGERTRTALFSGRQTFCAQQPTPIASAKWSNAIA